MDDHYGDGFVVEQSNKKRKGPPAMQFGAMRGDMDRMDKLNRLTNNFIDNTPAQIERVAWSMRPRRRNLEIQPQMRFKPTMQGERLFDVLTKTTPLYFSLDEMTGKEVVYDHNGCPVPVVGPPELPPDPRAPSRETTVQFETTENVKKFGMNFSRYSKRPSKLGLNTFHVKPRQMIEQLGTKRT